MLSDLARILRVIRRHPNPVKYFSKVKYITTVATPLLLLGNADISSLTTLTLRALLEPACVIHQPGTELLGSLMELKRECMEGLFLQGLAQHSVAIMVAISDQQQEFEDMGVEAENIEKKLAALDGGVGQETAQGPQPPAAGHGAVRTEDAPILRVDHDAGELSEIEPIGQPVSQGVAPVTQESHEPFPPEGVMTQDAEKENPITTKFTLTEASYTSHQAVLAAEHDDTRSGTGVPLASPSHLAPVENSDKKIPDSPIPPPSEHVEGEHTPPLLPDGNAVSNGLESPISKAPDLFPGSSKHRAAIQKLEVLKKRHQEIVMARMRFEGKKADHRDRILTFFALLEGIFAIRSPHHIREASDINSKILASMTSRRLIDVLALLLVDVASRTHFLHDCSGYCLRFLATLANVKEMETCRATFVMGSSIDSMAAQPYTGQNSRQEPLIDTANGKARLCIEGDGLALHKATEYRLAMHSTSSASPSGATLPNGGEPGPSTLRNGLTTAPNDPLVDSLMLTSPIARTEEKNYSVNISRNTALPGMVARIARRDTAVLTIEGSLRLTGVTPQSLPETTVSRLLATHIAGSSPETPITAPTFVSIPSYPPRQYVCVWQSFLKLPARKQAGNVLTLPAGMRLHDLMGPDTGSDSEAQRRTLVPRRRMILTSDIPVDYIFIRDALWQAPATVQMFGSFSAKEVPPASENRDQSGDNRQNAPVSMVAALLSPTTNASSLCPSALFSFLEGCADGLERFIRIDSITTKDFCSRLSFMSGIDQSTEAYRAQSFACCFFVTTAYYFRLLRQEFVGRATTAQIRNNPRMWPRRGIPDGQDITEGLELSDPRVLGFFDKVLGVLSPALQKACRKDIAGLGIQDFEGEAARIRGTELLREFLGFLRAYHSSHLAYHTMMVATATREADLCANPMYAKISGRTLDQARKIQLAEQRKLQAAEKELVDTVECLLAHIRILSHVVVMLENWQAVRKKEAYGFNHLECLLSVAADTIWLLKQYTQLDAGKRQVFRLARGFLSRSGREDAESLSSEDTNIPDDGADGFVEEGNELLLEPLQRPSQEAGVTEPHTQGRENEGQDVPAAPGDVVVRMPSGGNSHAPLPRSIGPASRLGAMPTDYGTVDMVTSRLVFGSRVLSNMLLLLDRAFDWSLSPGISQEAVAKVEMMSENIRMCVEILEACLAADEESGVIGACLLSFSNAFVIRNAMTKSRAALEACGYVVADSEHTGLSIQRVPPTPSDAHANTLARQCPILSRLYRSLHAIVGKFRKTAMASTESMVRTLIRPQVVIVGANEPMKRARQRLYTLMLDLKMREVVPGRTRRKKNATYRTHSSPGSPSENVPPADPATASPRKESVASGHSHKKSVDMQRDVQDEVARVVAQAAEEAANALDSRGQVSQGYEDFREDFDNDLRALFAVRLPEPLDGDNAAEERQAVVMQPANRAESSDDIPDDQWSPSGLQDGQVNESDHGGDTARSSQLPDSQQEGRGSPPSSALSPRQEAGSAYFTEQQDDYLLRELPSLARQYGGLEAALDVVVEKFDYFFSPEEIRERWIALSASAGPFSAEEDREIEAFVAGKADLTSEDWKVIAAKLLRRPEAVRKRAVALGLTGQKQKR